MDICPKCKATLNNDEKASGKCFSCGAFFAEAATVIDNKRKTDFTESSISDALKMCRVNSPENRNSIAKAIKICAIIILVSGTIGALASAAVLEKLLYFIWFEAGIIVSGLIFLGFSEIIQILDDIKNKLK